MNESPHKYLKVGIIHFMAFPETMKGEGPILETLTTIAQDDYFDLVEVTTIKEAATRAAVRSVLRQAKLEVAFGAQPVLLGGGHDLNAEDDQARGAAVTAVKAAIDEAYELGAKGLAVLSGKDPGPEQRAHATELLVDSLNTLCAYSATKGGMPVCLETFDRQPFGKNCLIGPTAEAVAVAAKVREQHPSFGLMVDLSHLPLLGETAEQMLETAQPMLAHVHVGNCVMRDAEHPAYGDNHPRFGIEGGENDVAELAEFLRVLLKIGYLDPAEPKAVSFEVKPLADERADLVIANAKRTLNRAWAIV